MGVALPTEGTADLGSSSRLLVVMVVMEEEEEEEEGWEGEGELCQECKPSHWSCFSGLDLGMRCPRCPGKGMQLRGGGGGGGPRRSWGSRGGPDAGCVLLPSLLPPKILRISVTLGQSGAASPALGVSISPFPRGGCSPPLGSDPSGSDPPTPAWSGLAQKRRESCLTDGERLRKVRPPDGSFPGRLNEAALLGDLLPTGSSDGSEPG